MGRSSLRKTITPAGLSSTSAEGSYLSEYNLGMLGEAHAVFVSTLSQMDMLTYLHSIA